MQIDDTIVAISSAAAPGPRIIVRASGPDVLQIAGPLFQGKNITQGPSAQRRIICLSEEIQFPAWVWRFISPRSYTGQDLLEFHIPGNPLLARMLLEKLVKLGARPADPGEFTARAYFNGKLDLTQAEGVAASISASSARELDAARQLMAGELSRRLTPIMDMLVETISLVEAGIDFSEEDIEFLSRGQISVRLQTARKVLEKLLSESGRFEALSHEPTIVLAGRPNAGKSTLVNSLCGQNRSIVSPQAGTTRDALVAHANLKRGQVRLIDVAGLDESEKSSGAMGEIQTQMRAQALRAVEEADVLVLVQEAGDARPALQFPRRPDLVVHSKIDLHPHLVPSPGTPGEGQGEGHFSDRQNEDPHPDPLPDYRESGKEISFFVSALTDTNMDTLRSKLDELAFGIQTPTARLALSGRHLLAIQEATDCLARAQGSPNLSLELLAADLRQALDSLGQILGQVTPDDILGKIFSTFCIGK
jgi:tRNA modification GTPase